MKKNNGRAHLFIALDGTWCSASARVKSPAARPRFGNLSLMKRCLLGGLCALVLASMFTACSDGDHRPSGRDAGASGKGSSGAASGGAAGEQTGDSAGEAGARPGRGGEPGAGAGPEGGRANGGSGGGGGGEKADGGEAASDTTFMLGADISSVQEHDYTYIDVDGKEKPLLEILKNHGFNYVRLKTFVDPNAPYGYASSENNCPGLPEAFGDRDHVVEFGQQIKAAGMGFLLNFHYSDVWADPGNQIIPEAWRDAADITALAALVKAYTKDVISTAIDAGARPDMVQIGNEITPGLLKDVPGDDTDCWGNNPEPAPFGGSVASWVNLGTLLKAGIAGVREVDPSIQIMLHIENTDDLGGMRSWVDNALKQKVDFDVLGLSCYTRFQGIPGVWETTFKDAAQRYPKLKFVIAEYNPERTRANLIMKNLPGGRGLGTFFWEPTRSGEWGPAMFDFSGGTATANQEAFAEFDDLRPQLGL